MKKSLIIYTETQLISGYFPKGKDSVFYNGTLTVTDNEKTPVTLELKIKMHPYVVEFPENKSFKADSVTEVYGKLSKWFSSYGFIFRF
ncbi:MAG: hypothetical protein WCP85_03290 [Mariniphaga sp.]